MLVVLMSSHQALSASRPATLIMTYHLERGPVPRVTATLGITIAARNHTSMTFQ